MGGRVNGEAEAEGRRKGVRAECRDVWRMIFARRLI